MIQLTLIALGLALLLVNAHLSPSQWVSQWLGQVASAILISGVIGVIDRQVLFRDALSKVRLLFKLQESVVEAGLTNVESNANEHDYSELIRGSQKLTIVMNDGRTWIGSRIADF
jgi:hypothetical protein